MADRPDHDLADRARALLDAAAPHICRSCGGCGWVDDENWWPEDWQVRAGVKREEGAGLIPCGVCSLGDWSTHRDERTEPTTVEDDLDRAEVLDLIAGLLAERDEYRRQLDTLRNALLDAIGDPDELRRVAVSVARDRKVTSAEAERRIGLLTRIAAAVGDPEPTNPDEPHPDADFIEVDYWCHFDDKGRAVRVHDASTVHMDGCTRMYVRAVGDPEEGRA